MYACAHVVGTYLATLPGLGGHVALVVGAGECQRNRVNLPPLTNTKNEVRLLMGGRSTYTAAFICVYIEIHVYSTLCRYN